MLLTCANVYKANILADIVSKVMADIPSATNAKLSAQLSEEETEYPSFDLFESIFAEPPAKRFASFIFSTVCRKTNSNKFKPRLKR